MLAKIKLRAKMSEDDEQQRAAAPPPSVSERLNRLFEVIRPPDSPERAWKNSEVVAATRSSGRALSEQHLSELRRGIKQNPTMRTLEALAWFFQVRVGYFTDDEVAAEVEQELQARQTELEARIKADREGREDVEAAAHELEEAMRTSGVTKMTHRAANSGMDFHQQASAMRALARDLLQDDEDDEDDDR